MIPSRRTSVQEEIGVLIRDHSRRAGTRRICCGSTTMLTVSQTDNPARAPERGATLFKVMPSQCSLTVVTGASSFRFTNTTRPIHQFNLRQRSKVELVGKENLSPVTRQRADVMAANTKQSGKMESLFGGFVRLTVLKDGLYRISADVPIWINVIDGNQPIERVRIAPRLRCGRIHKSLGFPLQREKSYWLELSGSTGPDVAILITEERDR